MYRNVVCDSALSLPGNYKAHVKMYHGNERSDNRIFPILRNNCLASNRLDEDSYSIASYSSSSTEPQWSLVLGEENKPKDMSTIGAQFLEWRVLKDNERSQHLPPIVPRALTSHVRRARTTSPLHDPQRKRIWLSRTVDPCVTSVSLTPQPKPKIVAHPCKDQYNNLKKTIERCYYEGHYPDSKERARKRPPSVSSHVSPQLLNGLILHHQNLQPVSNKGAIYVRTGVPPPSHFIVHPDWHLEPTL